MIRNEIGKGDDQLENDELFTKKFEFWCINYIHSFWSIYIERGSCDF